VKVADGDPPPPHEFGLGAHVTLALENLVLVFEKSILTFSVLDKLMIDIVTLNVVVALTVDEARVVEVPKNAV